MSSIDRIFEQATALVRQLSEEAQQRSRRKQKRVRRLLKRIVTLLGLLAISTFVIVVTMLSTGLLFGPRGMEGWLALPLILLTVWSSILYFGLRSKPAPRVLPSADIKQLPTRTEAWLEEQRWALPAPAQASLTNILQRLEALTPQVEKLDPQSPKAFELKRLIAEELPELVEGYQKVPRALRSRPSHGGPSPDRNVIDGLATIDEQMAQLEAQISEQHLRALATQQRYLELKYKKDRKLE
jgi:hypothetical protein